MRNTKAIPNKYHTVTVTVRDQGKQHRLENKGKYRERAELSNTVTSSKSSYIGNTGTQS